MMLSSLRKKWSHNPIKATLGYTGKIKEVKESAAEGRKSITINFSRMGN
jgi:hypothetical protein